MRQRGFSLIELMVTVSVLAILLAIGLPSFQSSMRSNLVATTSNELIAAMNLARSEAIRNARGGGICPSESGTDCDGTDWADGWIVWADTNADGALDDDDEVIRIRQELTKLTFGGSTAVIAFDARGRRRSTSATAITLQPSDCPAGHELLRRLTINAIGQVSIEKEECS